MTYRKGQVLNEHDLRPLIQEVLDDWAGVSFLGTADIQSLAGTLDHEIKARYTLIGRNGLRHTLDVDL